MIGAESGDAVVEPSAAVQLQIVVNQRLVGTLEFTSVQDCTFQYDPQWCLDGFAISPVISFKQPATAQALRNFLRNLFPEGGALDVLLQSMHLSKSNIYAVLLQIGHDTAGALTFLSPHSDMQPRSGQTADLRLVTANELSQRLNSNNPAELLFWDGKYRLSLAGVQNKLNVYVDNNQLYLAEDRYASTHIIKFASPLYPSIVLNELYCMRLAKALSIDVPDVCLFSVEQHHSLLVTRFDRRLVKEGVEKRHMIDGCQALDLPPENKYEQNFGSARDVAGIREGVSLAKLFAFAEQTSVPALTKQKILDWLLFNLLIGNSDAHGKNISFFMNHTGVTLAPFYDLVSILYEAKQQPQLDVGLAMAVGDNFDPHKITAFDLLTMAENVGIGFDLLKRRLDSMSVRCLNLAARLDFTEDNLSEEQILKIRDLSDLVMQRADFLLTESRQFKNVIGSCFS